MLLPYFTHSLVSLTLICQPLWTQDVYWYGWRVHLTFLNVFSTSYAFSIYVLRRGKNLLSIWLKVWNKSNKTQSKKHFSGYIWVLYNIFVSLFTVWKESEYRKKGTRKKSVFGHFSRSDCEKIFPYCEETFLDLLKHLAQILMKLNHYPFKR